MAVKAWVDDQYENGRVTVISNDELIVVTDCALAELGMKLEKKQ